MFSRTLMAGDAGDISVCKAIKTCRPETSCPVGVAVPAGWHPMAVSLSTGGR